jgi:hypothetical protein
MLKIRKAQLSIFFIQQLEIFLSGQLVNLRDKQFEKTSEFNDSELLEIIRQIAKWGITKGIVSSQGLEYLIVICIKFSIYEHSLNSENVIEEIVNYPDRSEDNKLTLLHYYFEYKVAL